MTSYVKNAAHIIAILRQQHVESTNELISFDITSLFTQVPINVTVDIIRNKHHVEDHLMDLTEHCLKDTYFTYNGQRYRQTKGAPMESPLSPIIANIFMKELKLWLKYVDDTFIIWAHGEDNLQYPSKDQVHHGN
ncbi:hypothetical protein Trydic_g4657 [Trypoxylus dichotomus]